MALTATQDSAQKVSDALEPVDGARDSVAAGCGSGSKVSSALDVLLGSERTRVENMGKRVKACLTGAVAATNAYVHADENMAHEVHRAQAGAAAQTRKLAR